MLVTIWLQTTSTATQTNIKKYFSANDTKLGISLSFKLMLQSQNHNNMLAVIPLACRVISLKNQNHKFTNKQLKFDTSDVLFQ
jgi:hypothetical protein